MKGLVEIWQGTYIQIALWLRRAKCLKVRYGRFEPLPGIIGLVPPTVTTQLAVLVGYPRGSTR